MSNEIINTHEMTEAERKAFELTRDRAGVHDWRDQSIAMQFFISALTHARGKQEPVAWPNRCDDSAVKALRFLADHERPSGGESRYNFTHLMQIASEIEAFSKRPLYAAPPAESAGEADEAYEVGKRDGYEAAVQDIDKRTGGDGEYRFCTDLDPDRHTPDAPAMIQRIVDRINAENEEVTRLRGELELAQADRDALLAALGFKPGPLGSARQVILDDAGALRPEMAKARNKLRDCESDAILWQYLCTEGGPPLSPLLLTVWQQRRAAERTVASLRYDADVLSAEFDIACKRHAQLIAAYEHLRSEMKWSIDTLEELNPSNYNHDDVCSLNASSVNVALRLTAALAPVASQIQPENIDNAVCVPSVISKTITFVYRNWRGEVSERTVLPKHIWWGKTDWHPDLQWLMTATDTVKGEDRDFALKDIQFSGTIQSKVKALVWIKHADRFISGNASDLSTYIVVKDFDGWRWMRVAGRQMLDISQKPSATPEEAQAGAQSHHESLIHSALEGAS